MHLDHRFDFLLGATRDIYRAHVKADAARVALVRAALHEDAREEVRRNAIVALTAAQDAAAVPDYIAALDQAGIRPVLDRTFGLDELADAFRHQQAGAHFGKVCAAW